MEHLSPDLSKARVGVIGGSGLYAIAGLEEEQELAIDTPFGRPSDRFRVGRLAGVDTVFLARHGRHHQFLPRDVPYRANLWAMRSLGVRWLISVSAVGSLQTSIRPWTWWCPINSSTAHSSVHRRFSVRDLWPM